MVADRCIEIYRQISTVYTAAFCSTFYFWIGYFSSKTNTMHIGFIPQKQRSQRAQLFTWSLRNIIILVGVSAIYAFSLIRD